MPLGTKSSELSIKEADNHPPTLCVGEQVQVNHEVRAYQQTENPSVFVNLLRRLHLCSNALIIIDQLSR